MLKLKEQWKAHPKEIIVVAVVSLVVALVVSLVVPLLF